MLKIEPLPLRNDTERVDWLQENISRIDFFEDPEKSYAPIGSDSDHTHVVAYHDKDGAYCTWTCAGLRDGIERLRRDPNYRR